MLIVFDQAHGVNVYGKCSPPLPSGIIDSHKNSPVIKDGRFREYLFSRYIINRVRTKLEEDPLYPYVTEVTCFGNNEPGLQERVNRANRIQNTYNADKFLLISLHCNAAGADDRWHNAEGACVYTTRGKTRADLYATDWYKYFQSEFPDMKWRADYSDGDPDYEANFKVLTCKMPAMLIEFGFQDNLNDVRKLIDPYFQDRLVNTFADWCRRAITL